MLNMCQILSLMAATESPVAEFSSFATLKKEKEIEPFDVIAENSSPKGFFWPNKKKSVISLLSADSRYFRTYALKSKVYFILKLC